MSRYRCTNCQETFEDDGARPRCPSCLRQNGLVAEAAPAPRRTRRGVAPRRLLIGLLVLSLLGLGVAGGVLFYRQRTELPAPGQLAQLDADLLRLTLLKRGVPAPRLVDPLTPGPGVKALVAKVAQADPAKRARAVAWQVAGRVKELAPRLSERGLKAALTPEQLLTRLADGGEAAPSRVTSYELATLLLAALRAADLPALLCAQYKVDAPTPTADPSGVLGRYLVAVYAPGALGRDPLAVLDPLRALKLPAWAGEGGDVEMAGAAAGLVPLDDASAAAHLLGLRALAAGREQPKEAYQLSRLALAAASPSATLLLQRALVLAASGGLKDAVAQARKALTVRADPPRHLVLAGLLHSSGNGGQAMAHLRQALDKDAAFWPAHGALAGLLLASGKQEEGEKLLARGLELAPQDPGLLGMDAAVKLANGELDAAVKTLERVETLAPTLETRILLYQVLLRAGKKERAAAQRTKVLEQAKGEGAAKLTRGGQETKIDIKKLEEWLRQLEEASSDADEQGGADPVPGAAADPGPGATLPDPPLPRFELPDVRLAP